MELLYWIGGILSIAIFVYLVAAMIKPEIF
jgi:K+-transporting ATPase KdpF subunit